MKLGRPVLWTLFGLGLGAGVTLAASQVQAPQRRMLQVDSRLIVTMSRKTEGWKPLYFIKDLKSAGCWIASGTEGHDFTAIAAAPALACE